MLVEYKNTSSLPIYAYIDDICTSGGMYIACAADTIYATPDAIVGSVGVRLGPVFNFSQLMETYGIAQKTLTAGKRKDEAAAATAGHH